MELDAAIEWAEDRLLSTTRDAIDDRVEVAEHEVLLGLSPAALERVEQRLERQRWAAGDVVVARGEPADALLLIVRGTVSVTVPRPGIGPRRLATLSAGMTVGELSFLGGEERTADVVADTDVEVRVLHIDRFRELQAIDPSSAGVLLENLLAILARTARRMTDEIALLAS
jgi:CRP-like cAMP-binding protein